MFYILLILIAVTAFFTGHRLGSLTEPKVKRRHLPYDSLKLKKEYENFLNYNGEAQP